MRKLLVPLLFLFLIAAAPAGFTPYLVKDINPAFTAGSSDPQAFVQLGGLSVFQVFKLGHRELWRSDGTTAGTYRLAEIGYPEILAVGGGRCLFRVQDPDTRWHLWITDGTLPGTLVLAESGGVEQAASAAWVPRQRLFYFVSQIPGQGHGTELWRTDGTPGGTYEVADIEPGPRSSNPAYLTGFQGRLFFSATDSVHGSALWQSDGTAQGTTPVREVPAGVLNVVGSRLVFLGQDAAFGRELWASDGTPAGTRRISDLAKGEASPAFHDLEVVGKRLFVVATTSQGQELYVTDGTAQGTRRLTAFSDPYALDQLPQTSLGNRLLFAAKNRKHGVELWISDGTAKGTRMVLDACPGACPSYPVPLLQHRGRLYYQATDGTHGFELWVTDGTAAGSRMVKDLCPGTCGSWPSALPSPGDRFLFAARNDSESGVTTLQATDGTPQGTVELAEFSDLFIQGAVAGGTPVFSGSDPDHGRELWTTDGTPEGTLLLCDIADEDVGGSDPRLLMPTGESLLFFARDGSGSALWKSDGTDAGTILVKRDLAGRSPWTASARRVFFQAHPRQGSFELWTSDGSGAGTFRVTPDTVRSLGELSQPVLKLGSRVFFSAWSPAHGSEPWITDGTPAGTRMVADLRPGPAPSSPRDFTVFQGRAWFVARFRMWKSDGTTAGTVALGPELRDMHPWTTWNGRVWFTGRNSRGRYEIWGTDGTAARTSRIAEVAWSASAPVLHAGRLWFVADGAELWSTDGTAAGTRKSNLLLPPSEPFRLLSDGVRLYLGTRVYTGGSTLYEIWVSDGTAANTTKIADLGLYGAAAFFNGRLYFVSDQGAFYGTDGTAAGTRLVRPDGEPLRIARLLRFGDRLLVLTSGGEMWQTDGTADGTKPMHDLSPESWYDSSQVVKAGPRLFFPAFDPETGWELWAMRE